MHDYDQQLLESVALRRDRLLAAVLFGEERSRRNFGDTIRNFMISLIIAALIAAGCVATSFVTNLFQTEQAKREQAQMQQTVAPTSSSSPGAGGVVNAPAQDQSQEASPTP